MFKSRVPRGPRYYGETPYRIHSNFQKNNYHQKYNQARREKKVKGGGKKKGIYVYHPMWLQGIYNLSGILGLTFATSRFISTPNSQLQALEVAFVQVVKAVRVQGW